MSCTTPDTHLFHYHINITAYSHIITCIKSDSFTHAMNERMCYSYGVSTSPARSLDPSHCRRVYRCESLRSPSAVSPSSGWLMLSRQTSPEDLEPVLVPELRHRKHYDSYSSETKSCTNIKIIKLLCFYKVLGNGKWSGSSVFFSTSDWNIRLKTQRTTEEISSLSLSHCLYFYLKLHLFFLFFLQTSASTDRFQPPAAGHFK